MLTGQMSRPIQRSIGDAPRRVFETRDFYLACFLRCMGYELIDLRPEGRRRAFVFIDRPERRDDVMEWGQAPARDPGRQEPQVHDPGGRAAALTR